MSATRVRRFEEQRWLIDAVIRTVGVEWDQARVASKSRPVGPEAEALFRATAARCRKLDDIHREFAAQARRQQERATAYESDGRLVAARETWMTAALLWSLAAWPIDEHNETLAHAEQQVNACYARFIGLAPRPIERVEIPFRGRTLPAYLHLPHEPAPGERFACVLSVPGMDSSKENLVALYGDKLIERDLAVLAMDGPGQAEAAGRRIYFSPEAWMEAAEAAYAWIRGHHALDLSRLCVRGVSFGSYFGGVLAAQLGNRILGFAATGVCHEPGCHTIFNMASPTFKSRFMWMSGYEDESAFDSFCASIDLRPLAPRITAPCLVIAGENDQLSPLEHTEALLRLIRAPRRLVVYEGASHGVGDAASVTLGEDKATLLADWLLDRVNGKPATSARVLIDSAGRARSEPLPGEPSRPPATGDDREP